MQLAKIQAFVKSAPNYRAMVGGLEVIGAPGKFRWSFSYVVRVARADGKVRTAYGKRNAEEYVATLADDTPINTDIKTFPAQSAKETAPNKFYNVGLETTDGRKVGMIVRADNLDLAIGRARAEFLARGTMTKPGSFGQLCDKDSAVSNEQFDRTYQFCGTLY
jgi:hypothetical protein